MDAHLFDLVSNVEGKLKTFPHQLEIEPGKCKQSYGRKDSQNCAIDLWNKSNTMFAIVLFLRNKGEINIASTNKALAHSAS